jgi:protein-tyrosine phosphatase
VTLRILFVCTGNICRSPMAEGAMRALLAQAELSERVAVDSAGIQAREGEAPDPTAIEIAAEHGIDISSLRGRQFQLRDFEAYNLILTMDRDQHTHLRFICPPGEESRLRMFMSYAMTGEPADVVDPYRRRRKVFLQAWRDIERGCEGLLRAVRGLVAAS